MMAMVLQNYYQIWLINFNVLNYRPTKFGMGNDYRDLMGNGSMLVSIVFGDLW